MQLTILRF